MVLSVIVATMLAAAVDAAIDAAVVLAAAAECTVTSYDTSSAMAANAAYITSLPAKSAPLRSATCSATSRVS